jgi:hypothetical protein
MGKSSIQSVSVHVLITSTVALRAIFIVRTSTPTLFDRFRQLSLFASIGSKTITAQSTPFPLIHRMNRISIFGQKLFTSVPTHPTAQPLTT